MAVPGAVTDPTAVIGSDVTYERGGTTIDAYLARPASGGPRPGIIVIHEAFGPVEHIHDVARRFANVGFDALAPNMYARTGVPAEGDMNDLVTKMFGVSDADAVADLEAGAAYLRSLDSSTGKVGCIGFCSGGRQTLLFAVSSTQVDAAVDCWGGLIHQATFDTASTPSRPTPPMDMAEQLSCPIFLVGGAEDENPSPAILTELEAKLRAAGKDVTLRIFDGAGHAFLADYRDSYREGPAHELWPQVVNFFKSKLS